MTEFMKVLKANPYRGTGGMFSSKAKATTTKLVTPKQVSKPSKTPVKDEKRPGALKF